MQGERGKIFFILVKIYFRHPKVLKWAPLGKGTSRALRAREVPDSNGARKNYLILVEIYFCHFLKTSFRFRRAGKFRARASRARPKCWRARC